MVKQIGEFIVKRRNKEDKIDEQLISEVTCWKCWVRLTKVPFDRAKFPFVVDNDSFKANNTFEAFLITNFIRRAGMNSQYKTVYKCPNCNYKSWLCNRFYYPYLYLWIEEIKKEQYTKGENNAFTLIKEEVDGYLNCT